MLPVRVQQQGGARCRERRRAQREGSSERALFEWTTWARISRSATGSVARAFRSR